MISFDLPIVSRSPEAPVVAHVGKRVRFASEVEKTRCKSRVEEWSEGLLLPYINSIMMLKMSEGS